MYRILSIAFVFGVIFTNAIYPARAVEQSLLAIVNDRPITSFDIDQQLRLTKLLAIPSDGAAARKRALNEIIDQIVKIDEAKRYRLNASDVDIDGRMKELAKGLNTDEKGLQGKLRKQGISMDAMRQYFSAQIGFARLLRLKYKTTFDAKPEEIDQRMAKIKSVINGRISKAMSDPRMRPIKVVTLVEITFPIEPTDAGMDQMLQSRAVEANQYMSRFKGCKTASAAASGIFNVRVGKVFEADYGKLPKPLQGVLDSKGPGSIIGPMRSKTGIQVVGYCGTRTIVPPKPKAQLPTREQVSQAVVAEKFESVEKKYVAQFRKNAIIEYRNSSYAQQY